MFFKFTSTHQIGKNFDLSPQEIDTLRLHVPFSLISRHVLSVEYILKLSWHYSINWSFSGCFFGTVVEKLWLHPNLEVRYFCTGTSQLQKLYFHYFDRWNEQSFESNLSADTIIVIQYVFAMFCYHFYLTLALVSSSHNKTCSHHVLYPNNNCK